MDAGSDLYASVEDRCGRRTHGSTSSSSKYARCLACMCVRANGALSLVHRHNSKSFFIGAGTGEFPAADVWTAWEKKTPGLNLVDPPLRGEYRTLRRSDELNVSLQDSFNTLPTLEGASWAVIRWRSTNPMPTLVRITAISHKRALKFPLRFIVTLTSTPLRACSS